MTGSSRWEFAPLAEARRSTFPAEQSGNAKRTTRLEERMGRQMSGGHPALTCLLHFPVLV